MNNDFRIDNAETVRPGFMDLSGMDKAKVVGLKVAKVAVVVLAAAALVAAVWFLAPVAIPAGIFTFGGSMAGLIGGGALLSAIEGLAFKKLNQIEDEIYSKYSGTQSSNKTEKKSDSQESIVVNLRECGVMTIYRERLNMDQIERDVEGTQGISRDQIERLTADSSNETRENIFFANSQSLLNGVQDYLYKIDPNQDYFPADGLERNEKPQFIPDEVNRCTTANTRLARAYLERNDMELFEVTVTMNWDTAEARIVTKELNISKQAIVDSSLSPVSA